MWIDNKSAGLKLFLSKLLKFRKAIVLDAGKMSGSNLQFLSSRGHKVYSDDILESSFNGTLDYERECFDAIILWESLDKVAHAQSETFIGEVDRILKPGGIVFMLTSSQKKTKAEGALHFRIKGEDRFEHTLGDDILIQKYHYTNRDLMKLLGRFKTLCFNLLKTGIREIVFEKSSVKEG